MTHDQYIANIQYKIDSLFYEYETIEMGKYQNYDYYNEYTNVNYYDMLVMEAEEKKGIIRTIIDGIRKIIRTVVDKVKSFFSKNKNIDKNATVKVDKNLLDRVDNFKKKSAKSKLGFRILKGWLIAAVGINAARAVVKYHNNKQSNSSNDKLSDVVDDMNKPPTYTRAKKGSPEQKMMLHAMVIQDAIKDVTKELEDINKELESLLSKNPEDLGTTEKEFLQQVSKLTDEGTKLVNNLISKLDSFDDDTIKTYMNLKSSDPRYSSKDIADRLDNVEAKFHDLKYKTLDLYLPKGRGGLI